MSIRSRFSDYALRAAKGNVPVKQLANFLWTRLAGYHEIVNWEPTHLSIFVTSRCNFHCDMCPTHSTKVPMTYVYRHQDACDMTVTKLRSILDHFPSALRVELIGVGEPLLNPQLFELVAECTKRKIIVDTVSNGVVLDLHANKIVTSGLDRICVSVNGHTSQEFQRVTGMAEAYHSRILSNVTTLVKARLRRKNPRIEVSFIVDQQNYRHMVKMVRVAEELGVDGANFYNFLPTSCSGFTARERCLYIDDANVCRAITDAMSQDFSCDITWPQLLRPFRTSLDARKVCRWPFTLLQVDGDGNVGGCPMMLLNMQDNGTLNGKDAWNNAYFQDLRTRHLSGNVPEPCKSCSECVGVDVTHVNSSRDNRGRT